jgi:PHD/YefM family antitoxin component YafN of YafNO toxin-antitoxin module
MPLGQKVLARLAVGLPSLRKNAPQIIRDVTVPVAIIDGERIAAYIVPAATFERMMRGTAERQRARLT